VFDVLVRVVASGLVKVAKVLVLLAVAAADGVIHIRADWWAF
jgi:hypothetical protein